MQPRDFKVVSQRKRKIQGLTQSVSGILPKKCPSKWKKSVHLTAILQCIVYTLSEARLMDELFSMSSLEEPSRTRMVE